MTFSSYNIVSYDFSYSKLHELPVFHYTVWIKLVFLITWGPGLYYFISKISIIKVHWLFDFFNFQEIFNYFILNENTSAELRMLMLMKKSQSMTSFMKHCILHFFAKIQAHSGFVLPCIFCLCPYNCPTSICIIIIMIKDCVINSNS